MGVYGQRSEVQVILLAQCSYICHFLSTCAGTSFISVNCIHLTSDLLTPEFYSPRLFSIPPVSWNGLKRHQLILPLFCSVHFPGSSRPVEGSLNSSGRNWRLVHHPSQYTFPLLLSVDPSCQMKWSIYSLSPKLTSLLSPLNLSPSFSLKCLLCSLCPNLCFHLQAQSKSHLLCDAAHVSPAGSGSPCLKSSSTFYWYFGLRICSLLGTICYHVIRYSYVDASFFLRDYSPFIARYCAFRILESLSEGSKLCPAYKG